jgi:hypothetical protein
MTAGGAIASRQLKLTVPFAPHDPQRLRAAVILTATGR